MTTDTRQTRSFSVILNVRVPADRVMTGPCPKADFAAASLPRTSRLLCASLPYIFAARLKVIQTISVDVRLVISSASPRLTRIATGEGQTNMRPMRAMISRLTLASSHPLK